MKHFQIRTLHWVILPMFVALLMSSSVAQAASTWKNGEWIIIPGQNPGDSSSLRSVAAISQNDAWAVGSYVVQQKHASYALIEHWNGKHWKVVPSPTIAFSALSAVTAISAHDVWAVGDYTQTNGVSRTLIEHWNGKNWKIVPSPNAGSVDTTNYLFAVSGSSATNVWAVGVSGSFVTLTERWDGSTWSIIPSADPGSGSNWLYGVTALSSHNVWAVGYSTDSTTGNAHPLIERWDGSSWLADSVQVPAATNSYLWGISAVSGNNIWAVGDSFNNAPSATQTLTVHWNGVAWSVISSPNSSNYSLFSSVTALSTHDIWAVGSYISDNTHTYQTLTEHWNGAEWAIVPSPNVGASVNFNRLLGVAKVPHKNEVWAVGETSYIGARTVKTLIEFHG